MQGLKRIILLYIFIMGYLTTGLYGASFQGLGDIPGGRFMSEAYDVSEDGSVVVGRSCHYVVHDIMSYSYYRAFRWTLLGGMTPIYDPSAQLTSYACAYGVSTDGSILAGEASTGASDLQAFRWETSSGFQGLGGKIGMDISNNGAVVVGRTSTRAFRWTSSSGIVEIGTLYGSDSKSYAHGVSGDGSVVVGYCFSRNDPYQAFIWTEPNGMIALGDLLGGAFSSIANAASDDG